MDISDPWKPQHRQNGTRAQRAVPVIGGRAEFAEVAQAGRGILDQRVVVLHETGGGTACALGGYAERAQTREVLQEEGEVGVGSAGVLVSVACRGGRKER